MKNFKLLFLLIAFPLISATTKSQNSFPNFLVGTWKVKNQQTYEQWNLAGENHLKGFSYKVVKKENIKTEDLTLIARNDSIVYLATVLNQNNGKHIAFKQNQIDSITYVYENPSHDFPQKITYKLIKENKLEITLFGRNNRQYRYTMKRVY